MRTSDGRTVDGLRLRRVSPLEWLRLRRAAPPPSPLPQRGRGSLRWHWAGISLAWSAGNWRVRPRMCLHSSDIAACAPRASRTTGSAATTVVGPANLMRARRSYFFGFSRSRLFKVDQQIASGCPATERRPPPAVVRAARGPTRGAAGWRRSRTRHRPPHTRHRSKNSCRAQRLPPLPPWGRGLGGGEARRQAQPHDFTPEQWPGVIPAPPRTRRRVPIRAGRPGCG